MVRAPTDPDDDVLFEAELEAAEHEDDEENEEDDPYLDEGALPEGFA